MRQAYFKAAWAHFDKRCESAHVTYFKSVPPQDAVWWAAQTGAADVLYGGAGDDAIAGDGGYSVVPRQGNDLLFGGDGSDDTYLINGESNDLLSVAFDTLAVSPILGDAAAEDADKPRRGIYRSVPCHVVNRQNTYYFRQIVRMKRAA